MYTTYSQMFQKKSHIPNDKANGGKMLAKVNVGIRHVGIVCTILATFM